MNDSCDYKRLERAHEAAGSHMMQKSPRADELIACLEGEIAKRDERIVELEDHAVRLGQGGAERYWEGRWRDADAELSKSMRQEPVGEVIEVNERGNCSFKGVINASAILEDLVVNGTKLYAAPVSEAKAKGVVQWPDADEIMQMAFEEGQPADDASGYCFELEEFDLFIERLMSEVARLNAAAPAAPVADAGLVAVEWAKDAEEWGPALNEAGWLFLSELNEDPQKSALIFNSTKGPLRAAIMKYAEIVAANAKDSSHD